MKQQLAPLSIDEGKSGDFIAKVTGTEPMTVKWFKDSQLLPNSTGFAQTYKSGEAKLHINKAIPEDAATFSVEISNEWGKTSSAASLTVKGKLKA